MGLVPGPSAFCPFHEDNSRAEVQAWLRGQRLRKGRNADMEGHESDRTSGIPVKTVLSVSSWLACTGGSESQVTSLFG